MEEKKFILVKYKNGRHPYISQQYPLFERSRKSIFILRCLALKTGGLLTPTFKAKRSAILMTFKNQIERLYEEVETGN